jgi:hypothetical protein
MRSTTQDYNRWAWSESVFPLFYLENSKCVSCCTLSFVFMINVIWRYASKKSGPFLSNSVISRMNPKTVDQFTPTLDWPLIPRFHSRGSCWVSSTGNSGSIWFRLLCFFWVSDLACCVSFEFLILGFWCSRYGFCHVIGNTFVCDWKYICSALSGNYYSLK